MKFNQFINEWNTFSIPRKNALEMVTQRDKQGFTTNQAISYFKNGSIKTKITINDIYKQYCKQHNEICED